MGTRKAGEQQIRNITTNSSGTYQISIPKQLVSELKWRSGQKVVVTKMGEKLLIEDWKE
jgi:bifunctional DNA-binding transcriptional regulator/antitoxin component of YhaV-PrlF toxin-antitoxin module